MSDEFFLQGADTNGISRDSSNELYNLTWIQAVESMAVIENVGYIITFILLNLTDNCMW